MQMTGMATTISTTDDEQRATTTKVNIEMDLKEQNWKTFQGLVMLDDKTKKQFLSDVVNDMLEHFLYNNPELFNSYVSLSRTRLSQ